jgi:hypothetical protein
LAICKNNQQNEIEERLKKLKKLIKNTNNPVKPKFSWRGITEAIWWWLRPRWWVFFASCAVFLIEWYVKRPLVPRHDQNELLRICLSVATSIFVIGISVTTLAHRLGESGQLTAEYLHKACRLPVFTCQSFLSIFLAIAAFVFPSSSSEQEASLLTYIALGSTIATIPFFLFIILTLIKCANPQEAIEATTKFSTTWLVNSWAKHEYYKISQRLAKEKRNNGTNEHKPIIEEEEGFENHSQKILNALTKAVEVRSLEGIQAWLNCSIEPVHHIFEICKTDPSYQQDIDYDPRRIYETVRFYALALDQLLVLVLCLV